jgi:hypothetical protein
MKLTAGLGNGSVPVSNRRVLVGKQRGQRSGTSEAHDLAEG